MSQPQPIHDERPPAASHRTVPVQLGSNNPFRVVTPPQVNDLSPETPISQTTPNLPSYTLPEDRHAKNGYLMDAIKSNQFHIMENRLKECQQNGEKLDINYQIEDGSKDTLLHLALRNKELSRIVEFLMNAKEQFGVDYGWQRTEQINPRLQNGSGDTIVHEALKTVNASSSPQDKLMLIEQAKKVLAVPGINPALQNKSGQTILHEVVKTKDEALIKDVLKILEKSKSDSNPNPFTLKDNEGRTALDVFAMSPFPDINNRPPSQTWKAVKMSKTNRYQEAKRAGIKGDIKEVKKIAKELINEGLTGNKQEDKCYLETALTLAKESDNTPVIEELTSMGTKFKTVLSTIVNL